jgi:hypothetical protein
MIQLNHIELTDPNGTKPDGEDGTLLRYWQAEVPESDLFALTEEACTRVRDSDRHARHTRFFVGTQGATSHGMPFGRTLVQDELNHGDHFPGPIAPAIRELTGPTEWDDAPRQRMLEEAIAMRQREIFHA